MDGERQQRRERRAVLAVLVAAVVFIAIVLVLRLQDPGAAPALVGQILMGIIVVALLVGAVLFYRAWHRQNPPPVRPPPRGKQDAERILPPGDEITPRRRSPPSDGDPRHPE